MGVLIESWCFCKGVGKSERMKAAIFSGKAAAIARILSSSAANGVSGTGFLIHRNLLLTAHVNIPSVAAAESCEIRLQNGVAATLVPHRFFITSSVLDLTIVGLDTMDGESNVQGQHPHYLKTCSKPNLDLGSIVYFLGHTDKEELTVGEGKVVIATDNLIKLSTDGIVWSPGSAGFDTHGNLAFMICDPMKLATSPNTKCSSTSSSSTSWKRDSPLQFGIPIPIICDWLNQHWEGSLDELTKPKLPIIRLMSSGQKSENSCASFTLRQVFKSIEADNNGTPSSSNTSNTVSKSKDQPRPGSSGAANSIKEETGTSDPYPTHVHGIATPEIYESPKLTSVLIQKESAQVQLLDINFPPRVTKVPVQPLPEKQLAPNSDENSVQELPLLSSMSRDQVDNGELTTDEGEVEVSSTGSVNGAQSEVQSSSYPVDLSDMHNEYSSEGETTMYSAETAESRNYTSPREGKFQPVGRSHSCVNYNRWGTGQRNPVARRAMLEQQRSFIHGRKMYSQGATSQRSNDFLSPTVSSIMKKRNNSEQPTKRNILEQPAKQKQSAVHSSPRWMF